MPETRSLHRKLAQVMYEADRIPKNGTAPAAMGGFKFVQVGDAADVIRKSLAEKGVSMIPTQIDIVDTTEHASGADGKKVMTTMTVRTTWTLTDADTGETTVIQSLGSGGDTGDKAAPKAQSNAMKYALLMGFLLSTGDDPEQTDTSDRQARRPPATPPVMPPREPVSHSGPPQSTDGLIGIVEQGDKTTSDFEIRYDPEGIGHLGFRLKGDKGGILVEAAGELAEDLMVSKADLIGSRVTAWGRIEDRSFPRRDGGTTKYQALNLERLSFDGIMYPVAKDAPTIPLFTDSEDAALDAVVTR